MIAMKPKAVVAQIRAILREGPPDVAAEVELMAAILLHTALVNDLFRMALAYAGAQLAGESEESDGKP